MCREKIWVVNFDQIHLLPVVGGMIKHESFFNVSDVFQINHLHTIYLYSTNLTFARLRMKQCLDFRKALKKLYQLKIVALTSLLQVAVAIKFI